MRAYLRSSAQAHGENADLIPWSKHQGRGEHRPRDLREARDARAEARCRVHWIAERMHHVWRCDRKATERDIAVPGLADTGRYAMAEQRHAPHFGLRYGQRGRIAARSSCSWCSTEGEVEFLEIRADEHRQQIEGRIVVLPEITRVLSAVLDTEKAQQA